MQGNHPQGEVTIEAAMGLSGRSLTKFHPRFRRRPLPPRRRPHHLHPCASMLMEGGGSSRTKGTTLCVLVCVSLRACVCACPPQCGRGVMCRAFGVRRYGTPISSLTGAPGFGAECEPQPLTRCFFFESWEGEGQGRSATFPPPTLVVWTAIYTHGAHILSVSQPRSVRTCMQTPTTGGSSRWKGERCSRPRRGGSERIRQAEPFRTDPGIVFTVLNHLQTEWEAKRGAPSQRDRMPTTHHHNRSPPTRGHNTIEIFSPFSLRFWSGWIQKAPPPTPQVHHR